jgi:hypothetical protein
MMTSNSETEKVASPLWEYVPIADYHPPAAPVTHSLRERFAVFRRLFRRGKPEQDSPLKAEDKLRALPRWQLERIAPAPKWRSSAEALDNKLEDWLLQEKPDQPVIVVVGPPHSGNTEILRTWAEQQSWRLLSPPSPEQVLAGDDNWLSHPGGDSSPWVFPVLERAYLRHTAGLNLIRRFLDRACSGNLGRGIIGCDSWAWTFLYHLWRGRRPITLTLQALDQARLVDLFQRFRDASNRRKLLFRQSDNGHYVLPPPDTDEVSGEASNFLQILAAHSRGIFGVAWAVWRASMQTEPDENIAEEDGTGERKIPNRTVWIIPWNQLNPPLLPSGAGRDEAFVLHTLLLHNGLPLELLQQLLSLSPSQVIETIFRLDEEGLVAEDDTVWKVTPRGYPAVRQFLQSNGYLVDQF